jgi:hypothetical protein
MGKANQSTKFADDHLRPVFTRSSIVSLKKQPPFAIAKPELWLTPDCFYRLGLVTIDVSNWKLTHAILFNPRRVSARRDQLDHPNSIGKAT